MTWNPAEAEAEIKTEARALSKRYSEKLCHLAGDLPHDTAFLTVIAGIRDVARHLGNIAERIPVLG